MICPKNVLGGSCLVRLISCLCLYCIQSVTWGSFNRLMRYVNISFMYIPIFFSNEPVNVLRFPLYSCRDSSRVCIVKQGLVRGHVWPNTPVKHVPRLFD